MAELKALVEQLDSVSLVTQMQAVWELSTRADTSAVLPLVRYLKKCSPKVRWIVIHYLGEIGDSRAVEHIIPFVGNKYIFSQRNAKKALLKIIKNRNLAPFVRALKDKRHYVRNMAAKLLHKFGWAPSNNNESALYFIARRKWRKLAAMRKDAVKPLIHILVDKKKSIRNAAVKILGKIGDTEAIEPLIEGLKDDLLKRRKVIRALRKIKVAGAAFEPFVKILTHPNQQVRATCAKVLDAVGWQPTNNSETATYLASGKKWKKLSALGIEAIDSLTNLLEDNEKGIREKAVEVLGDIKNSRVVEPLISALKDRHYTVRAAAIKALIKTGDARAVEPLIAAMKDKSVKVRMEAAAALNRMEDGPVEFLIHALEDEDSSIRQNAAKLLGKIADAAAAEPLTSLLEDPVPGVRGEAAMALGRLKTSTAIERLIDMLEEDAPVVRKKVVPALGSIGDTRAVEPLIRALEDPVPEVRKNTVQALEK